MTQEGLLKKILVIDDSHLSRVHVKLALEKRAYTVMELDNADAYFRCLWNYTDVGLILLDLRLPGMSGIEVLERMKEYACNAWPPVVIVSASQDAHTITQAVKLGAKDYLMKPFTEEELWQRVERHFGSLNEVVSQECRSRKELWGIFFTAAGVSMGSGVAVIDGTQVAGGTSRYYFTGYCNLRTDPVTARIVIDRFAPGPSMFGTSIDHYTLVLSGTHSEDEISLKGYMEERPGNKVTSRMKKLVDL